MLEQQKAEAINPVAMDLLAAYPPVEYSSLGKNTCVPKNAFFFIIAKASWGLISNGGSHNKLSHERKPI